MAEDNSRNLLYFESETMRGLFEVMDAWQKEHGKRLLSTQVQQDRGRFCCIALTNPMEVVIVSGGPLRSVASVYNGQLSVTTPAPQRFVCNARP